MRQEIKAVSQEIQKAIIGKEETIRFVLMAILADGHILLDDVPGVGKTTLALALSRTLGLAYRRVQFTPDVLPSDIVGFSVYDRETGQFRYMPGVVTQTNLLLGDEINRTSSKTQSALLEAMEENQVTVDGIRHELKHPFCVIATQNQVGTAGTQKLPQAEMDRFLVQLSIGYPDPASEMTMIQDRKTANPLDLVQTVSSPDQVLAWQRQAADAAMSEEIVEYITRLAYASRVNPMLQLGISPRGSLAISRMARVNSWVDDRDYVTEEDVQKVFVSTCAHRVILSQRAQISGKSAGTVLEEILQVVPLPGRKKK